MAAAPLLVSTDVRKWTPFMKSVLLNKEIIAIDQVCVECLCPGFHVLAVPGLPVCAVWLADGTLWLISCVPMPPHAQDPLGVAGGLVDAWPCAAPSGTCQVWARPLADGCKAAALFNSNEDTHSITLKFDVIKGWTDGTSATVRDLWAHKDLGTFTGSYSSSVPPHGTVMVKLCEAESVTAA